MSTRTLLRSILLTVMFVIATTTRGAELPLVTGVELQPLAAQVTRLREALDYLGARLSAEDQRALAEALLTK